MKLILLLISFNLFAQWVWQTGYTTPTIGPPTCCGGTGATSNNCDPGRTATGFGAGGGSSGWAGGSGGDAYWIGGGGGGGVGGYGACSIIGGAGGNGTVVIQYFGPGGVATGSVIGSEIYTQSGSKTIPAGVDTIRFWATGGGGSGGTASTNDGTASSGGGAGATAHRTIGSAAGLVLNMTIGKGGIPIQTTAGSAGTDGGTTSVTIGATTTTAGGGTAGRYNSGTSSAGGACSGTYDGCLLGGTAAGRSGDVDGTPGASIGASGSGGDGNNDDGMGAPNPVDVAGLFSAVNLSRVIYTVPNNGLSMFTGALPRAAFSFRKLIDSYTGPLFRVRRSSDNQERDIGLSGDYTDITALKAFVGTTSGYVTIWYNQNTAYPNATQTTAAAQPRIVNAGIVDSELNSNIAHMYLDGATWFDSNQGAQSITNAGNEGTVLIVARPFGGNSNAWTFGVANDGASNRWMAHFPYQGGQAYNAGEIYFDVGNLNTQRCHTGTTTPHDTWKVWSMVKRADRSQVYWGKILGCTSQIVTGQRYTGNENFHIGQSGGPTAAGQRYRGFMAEFIVYNYDVNATELSNYQQLTGEFFGLRIY
jgi:hypothetical protein